MYQRRYNNDMLHVMVSLQGFLETLGGSTLDCKSIYRFWSYEDASGHKALRLEYDRHKYVKFAFLRPRKSLKTIKV